MNLDPSCNEGGVVASGSGVFALEKDVIALEIGGGRVREGRVCVIRDGCVWVLWNGPFSYLEQLLEEEESDGAEERQHRPEPRLLARLLYIEGTEGGSQNGEGSQVVCKQTEWL